MNSFQYSPPPKFETGFSLVELMIALTLGLAIVAAVGTLSVNASRSYRAMNRASEQIENGRYALKTIQDDLEHAGFFGTYAPSTTGNPPQEWTSPCVNSPSVHEKSLLLPVTGYSSTPPNCSLSMDAGTRLISIRRADVKQTAVADLQSNTAYIQSAADRYVISVNSGSSPAFAPANATGFNLQGTDGISPIRQYHVLIYYLSNQTLMVWDASSNSTPQPVVDGIENMQIEYGIDQNNDGSPDSYSCSPTTAQDMSNTVTVGLHLLARSTEIDPSHTDTRTYNLGCLTVGAKNDHYRRRVFSQVVGLTNVIRRRE